eukprot:Seg378.21_Seg378.17 transcript_id=Seg378.21_Seg378.17/GoldUCD/mRNA.D3Y31 product="hypothetical protein" protein_id=Seg378.21_Seg378.17/GoldUCD/D3Y31
MPEYEILPAQEAEQIQDFHDLQPVAVRVVRRKKEQAVVEIHEGDSEDDYYGESLAPGNIELINLRRFRPLKVFLNATGNFTRAQIKSSYGSLFNLWRYIFIGLVIAYTLFALGMFPEESYKRIKPVIIADSSGLTFTVVHDAVYLLKWVVSCILGSVYHKSGHLEKFLTDLRLSSSIVAKARRHGSWYLGIIIIMVILLPTTAHSFKHYDMLKTKSIDLFKAIAICDFLFIVFTILTVPSFCVVTAVLYLIKVQIDTLGKVLKCVNVNLGVAYAEREIRGVKKMTRRADTKLKWYLLCHIMLVLITAFTGIFSCIERLEFKLKDAKNETRTIKQIDYTNTANFTLLKFKVDDLKRELFEVSSDPTSKIPAYDTELDEMTLQKIQINRLTANSARLQRINKKLLDLTLQSLMETQIRHPPSNTTTTIRSSSGPSKVELAFITKARPLAIFLESSTSLIEVIVLFLIPLMLLSWHDRALLRITDEIFDLDEEEQRRKGFLIDNKETKAVIVSCLKSMSGVRIFGMQVTFYKAAFIAVLAPFVTMILHVMFKRYGLY